MLDTLFSKHSRDRQPSVITETSVDTTSNMTSVATITTINKRATKNKAKESGEDTLSGDANSHHSQSSADDESSLVSVRSGMSKCCKQGSLGLRRWQLFQMLFLPFIPITALIVQNSTLLSGVAISLQEAFEMRQQINTITHIGKLLVELQQERAELGFCLFTNAPELKLNASSHLLSSSISEVFNHNLSSSTIHSPTKYNRESETLKSGFLPPINSSSSSSSTPPTSPTTMAITTVATLPASLHEKGMSEKMRGSLCKSSLSSRFSKTESDIQNLSTYVSAYVPTIWSLRTKRERIFQLTGKGDSVDDTALDELLWYNVVNDVILDLLSNQIRKTTTSGVWKVLIAYKNVIRCIENYSISMIYGLYYFGKGKLSQNSYNKYIQFDSLASDYLNATKSFSPEITVLWDRLIRRNWKQGFEKILERRAMIYRNDREEISASMDDANIYYANMTNFIEELRKFQTHLTVMLDDKVIDEIIAAKVNMVAAVVLLCIVMLISPVIIFLVGHTTKKIQQYSMLLTSKTMELKREKRKSDRLLKQMLPAEVIRQLRAKKQVPAESFESVTIYFSDIVSFTSISSSSSPMEIVVMLNSLYKMFDSRIEYYDVYKVETIGDAYMVVSGLPTRNGNLHAGEICTMALDLIAGVRNFEIPHRPGVGLQIRVGVNTGCCVAGVVGTRMPRYCLFGDAINVASRMESHGAPMKIHITESTKILLDELGGYITEDRGVLDVKGKGTMNTFWLVDKVGGIPRFLEMTTPGFFEAADDHTPEFLREMFGNMDSQDDGGDMEAVQLSVGKLPTNLTTSRKPRHSFQSCPESTLTAHHVPRHSTASFLSTRFHFPKCWEK